MKKDRSARPQESFKKPILEMEGRLARLIEYPPSVVALAECIKDGARMKKLTKRSMDLRIKLPDVLGQFRVEAGYEGFDQVVRVAPISADFA